MLKDIIQLWCSKPDLTKLQSAYAVVGIAAFVVAGLIGLINHTTALQILSFAWIITIAFFVNLVAFSLINLLFPSEPKTPVETLPARPRKRH